MCPSRIGCRSARLFMCFLTVFRVKAMPLHIAVMKSGIVVLMIVLGRDGGGTPTCLGGLVVVAAFAAASFFVFVSRGYLVHRVHHYVFSAGVRGDVVHFSPYRGKGDAWVAEACVCRRVN